MPQPSELTESYTAPPALLETEAKARVMALLGTFAPFKDYSYPHISAAFADQMWHHAESI